MNRNKAIDPLTDQLLIKTLLLTLLEADKDESWIGVDFDGTLAKHTEWKGPEHIGAPIQRMVDRVRRWVREGKTVKIFTARADDEVSVNAIKKWLKEHDLPDLVITNLKDRHMTKLWDDKAVTVERNTGEVKECEENPPFLAEDFIAEVEQPSDYEEWEPTPYVLQWFNNMLARMHHHGIDNWVVPDTGQIYKIDFDTKNVTLVRGKANDPEGWHHKTKMILQSMGYTVHDEQAPSDEQSFSEAKLAGSPGIKEIKKHGRSLSPQEKGQLPKNLPAGDGATVLKAVIDGQTWYACYTHRSGQVRKTLRELCKVYPSVASTA